MTELIPVATPYDNPETLMDRLLFPTAREAWFAGYAEGSELGTRLRMALPTDTARAEALEAAVLIGKLGLTNDQMVDAARKYMMNPYPTQLELTRIRDIIDRRIRELGDQ